MRFFIEGNINPWVLLANGDLKEVTQKELKTLSKENKALRVGEGFKYIDDAGKEVEGVVVGSNAKPSAYIKQLEDIKATKGTEGLKNEYSTLKQELEAGGDLDKIIYNRQSTYELRKGIGKIPKDFQAHHIIPRELKDKFKEFFKKIGFNIENGTVNGIMVPPSDEALKVAKLDTDIRIGNQFDDYSRHLGSHPDYTEQIAKKIAELNELYLKIPNPTSQQKEFFLDQVIVITNKSKLAISKGKEKL